MVPLPPATEEKGRARHARNHLQRIRRERLIGMFKGQFEAVSGTAEFSAETPADVIAAMEGDGG